MWWRVRSASPSQTPLSPMRKHTGTRNRLGAVMAVSLESISSGRTESVTRHPGEAQFATEAGPVVKADASTPEASEILSATSPVQLHCRKLWTDPLEGTAIRPPDAAPEDEAVPPEIAAVLLELTRALGPVSAWGEAAHRELHGHLAELGLPPEQEHPLEAVAHAELKLAREWKATLTATEYARAMQRALAAQALTATPHSALFGFTRLIDARFRLTPEVLDALVETCAGEHNGIARLLENIEHGPKAGEDWGRRPRDKVELVAALVRQLALGWGASLQLAISNELARWMSHEVERAGGELHESMGGAAAFGANLAGTFAHVTPRFFIDGKLPGKIHQTFGPRIELVAKTGISHTREPLVDDALPARINFSCEYRQGWAFHVQGRERLPIDGEIRSLRPGGTGRVILGTPTEFSPGFGDVPEETLERLGRGHAFFFLVGPHYFTGETKDRARSLATQLAKQLDALRRGNPSMLRHYQYVVPKRDENELPVMESLRGHIESLSLNAVELPGLQTRLAAGGIGAPVLPPDAPREESEEVENVLAGAAMLRECMQLQRVHIHGAAGDLVVCPTPADPGRMVLTHLRARQLASMKAANRSGQLRDAEDVWTIAPVVTAQGLAGVHSFADALRDRFALNAQTHAEIIERWYWSDRRTGLTWAFVPTRGIHEDTGGKVSLGDTMDLVPLLLAEH